ncbi:Peroxisome biosynthesis protein pex1, partial [Gonapodya sp. JEL0774]
ASEQTEEIVEVDADFGQALGLKEGQKVTVSVARNVKVATRVDVEPLSEDDWEIMVGCVFRAMHQVRRSSYILEQELHAGLLEQQLLSQLRVVFVDQVVTVWVRGQTVIRLKVLSFEPSLSCVRLDNDSEVIVAPKVRRRRDAGRPRDLTRSQADSQTPTQTPNIALDIRLLSAQVFGTELDVAFGPGWSEQVVLVNPSVLLDVSDFRVDGQVHLLSPSPGSRPVADLDGQDSESEEEASHKSRHRRQKGKGNDRGDADDAPQESMEVAELLKGVYVRVRSSNKVPPGHLVVGTNLLRMLNLTPFSSGRLSTVTAQPTIVAGVTMHRVIEQKSVRKDKRSGIKRKPPAPLKDAEKVEVGEKLRAWLEAHHFPGAVITDGLHFHFPEQGRYVLRIQGVPAVSEVPALGLAPKEGIEDLKCEFGDDLVESEELSASRDTTFDEVPPLGGVDAVLKSITEYLRINLGYRLLRDQLNVPPLGGLLVVGGHGAGKTSVCKMIMGSQSRSLETLTYCMLVSCAELAEERVSKVRGRLELVFREATAKAPSMVVFDDLDRMLMAEQE